MKAIRLHEPIGVEGLVYEDAPDPTPALGDVLIKVHAAGITPTELEWPIWKDRAGHARSAPIPAQEFSGVVAAVGFGTAGLAVGDEVYGLTMAYWDGAAADYIAVEAWDVAPKPRTLDHVHAAALPQVGLTSWQALFDHGHLAAGQSVLILGAGGAVGSTAVQLACAAGAHVVGAGRGNVKSLVMDLGADRFVDLEQPAWEEAIGPVDLVYDIIGGDVLTRSLALVKPGGALVTVMGPPPATGNRDIRALFFVRQPSHAQLVELGRRVDAGQLRVPPIGGVFPLAEARKAFAAKANGKVAGKIILRP